MYKNILIVIAVVKQPAIFHWCSIGSNKSNVRKQGRGIYGADNTSSSNNSTSQRGKRGVVNAVETKFESFKTEVMSEFAKISAKLDRPRLEAAPEVSEKKTKNKDGESEEDDESSDDDERKSRLKIGKFAFPELPKKKDDRALNVDDLRDWCTKVAFYADRTRTCDLERIITALKDTPYVHYPNQIYKSFLKESHEEMQRILSLKGKAKKKAMNQYNEQIKTCFREMLASVHKDAAIVKTDMQTAEELDTLSMRASANSLSECNIWNFTKLVKEKTAPLMKDASRVTENLIVVKLLSGLTPTYKRHLMSRIPDEEKRTVDNILKMLPGIERDLSDQEKATHLNELKAQASRTSTASAKDQNKAKNGVANAVESDVGGKVARTCWICGHDHHIYGQRTECRSPPNPTRAAEAKKKYLESRKGKTPSDKNSQKNARDQLIQGLANSIQTVVNDKLKAEKTTTSDASETTKPKAEGKANAISHEMFEEALKMIDFNGKAIHVKFENADGFRQALEEAELPVILSDNDETIVEGHANFTISQENSKIGMNFGLRSEEVFYQPHVVSNGRKYAPLAVLVDSASDGDYIARERLLELMDQGMVVAMFTMPFKKGLGGIGGSGAANMISYYAILAVDDGLGVRFKIYEAAITRGLCINGTKSLKFDHGVLDFGVQKVKTKCRDHTVFKSTEDDQHYYGHSLVVQDEVEFDLFTDQAAALKRASEMLAEMKEMDQFTQPREPCEIFKSNVSMKLEPRRYVAFDELPDEWTITEASKEDVDRWCAEGKAEALKQVSGKAILSNPLIIAPKTSQLLDVELTTPLVRGQAFCAIDSGNTVLSVSNSGVSSFDEDHPDRATVWITNSGDEPFVVDDISTRITGEILEMEEEVKIHSEGHCFVAQVEAQEPPPDMHGVETEKTSLQHKKVAERVRERFAKIQRIPFTYIWVLILFAGIGGMTRAFQQTNELHGTSFRIAGVIDNDKHVLDVHRRTFPDVPVIEWTLGKSRRKTYDKIAEVLPRHQWENSLWFASVDCRSGSSANFNDKDILSFVGLTVWTINLCKASHCAMWILEQIPRIKPHIIANAPHLQTVDLHDYADICCVRRRVIASSHNLDLPKHKGPRLTLQDYLDQSTPEFGGKPVIVKTAFGQTRPASKPTPTVTSGAFRIGLHQSETRPVTIAEVETILGVDHDFFQWPEKTSTTRKRKDLAQIVPPKPGVAICLAAHNVYVGIKPRVDFSLLMEDVCIPYWNPSSFFRKLPDSDVVTPGYVPYVDPHSRNVYWLTDTAKLPIQKMSSPEWTADGPNFFGGASTAALAQAFSVTTTTSNEFVTDEGGKVTEKLPEPVPPPKPPDVAEGKIPWKTQPYEKFRGSMPWIGKPTDKHGNPVPLHPPHLEGKASQKVEQPSPEQLEKVLIMIGAKGNPMLGPNYLLFLRHAISYAWAAFDEHMRPVDGDPISLKFKDRDQKPIKLPPYRLTPEKIECLRKQIEEWERDGILRKGSSASPWAFPCLLLPKKGGTPGTSDAYRLVVDFRPLNRLLEDDSYPLPHLDDAIVFLAGKKFQSTADLRWGYHNCSLSEDDFDKGDGKKRSWSSADVVTFSSPLGTRTYLRIPLGVKVAGQHFNRQSDKDLSEFLYRDLYKFVDDLMIANESLDEHMKSLANIFVRLAERGYSVKPKKVKVLPTSCEFLGHESGPEGVKPLEKGIDALKRMPIPKIGPGCDRVHVLKQLRSFLGLASYNRRYVLNFSKVAAPLNRLLEKDAEMIWKQEHQDAWDAIINAIAETRGVFHPDYDYPFKLRVDACKDGIGAYLFQEIPVKDESGKERKEERVVEYFSRSLPKPVRNYDSRRLEMLAVIEALEHFKPLFDGRKIQIESDHRNLSYLRRHKDASGQLGRWAMRLEEFNHSLNYRPGKDQPVSDALSRNPLPEEIDVDEDGVPRSAYMVLSDANSHQHGLETSVSFVSVQEHVEYQHDPEEPPDEFTEEDFLSEANQDPVTTDEIRNAQAADETCQRIREHLASDDEKLRKNASLKFQVYKDALFHIESDQTVRMVVPESLRYRVIREYHDSPWSGHVGRQATVDQLQRRFYWPNLQADVQKYINSCITCQKARSVRQKRAGLLQQADRGGDLQVLSIDLYGPLPGHPETYILVMIDPFSHYLTLSILKTKEATSVFEAFKNDILLKGRLPRRIILSDNGTEFKNQLFAKFVDQLRGYFRQQNKEGAEEYLKHLFISPYSPQQNPVERVNRFIGTMLKSLIHDSKDLGVHDWPSLVPFVEYVYNKIRIPGTALSPYMLRHGREPLEPSDWQYVSDRPLPNRTMSEHYEMFRDQFEAMEQAVRQAHSYAQSKQESQYNASQFDIEYEVGDQVLVWSPKRKNKLMYAWKGPYVITDKINPAVYKVRDPTQPDAPPRLQSIRNLIRLKSRVVAPPSVPSPKDSSAFKDLEVGKFIIFRMEKKR